MDVHSIQIWGDSVLKGVFFDEARSRYAIVRDNAVRLLGQALKLPIINRCAMGRTAPEGLSELEKEETPLDGALVLIEYGGNDCDMDWAAVSENPQAEHLPKTLPEQFEKALRAMAELVRSRGGLPVISTLPPLHAQRYFDWVSRGLSRDNILRFLGGAASRIYRWQELYSDIALRAAAEIGCACLSLREYFLENLVDQDIYSLDGIHLNEQGQRMMAEAALRAIKRQMPQLLPAAETC